MVEEKEEVGIGTTGLVISSADCVHIPAESLAIKLFNMLFRLELLKRYMI
jgi:hypothetical protein